LSDAHGPAIADHETWQRGSSSSRPAANLRESEERVNSALNQNSNGVSAGMTGPALVSEPPLSPPSPRASAQVPAAPQPERPVLEVAPPPAPADAPAVSTGPEVPAELPLEGLLLRFGLITTEQLTEAMRERSATGKDIGRIVVERGWVDAAQLARVVSYGPAFKPEPAADPDPEPVVEPEPEPAPPPAAEAAVVVAVAPTPTPPVAVPTGQRVKVFVRLTSGDRVDAGTFDGLDGAKERGTEIARTLAGEAPEWPFVAGRFLRPDTIISFDVEPELSV
jgi:hypothetical protein